MIDTITLIIILIALVIAFFIGQKIGSYRKHKEWEEYRIPGELTKKKDIDFDKI